MNCSDRINKIKEMLASGKITILTEAREEFDDLTDISISEQYSIITMARHGKKFVMAYNINDFKQWCRDNDTHPQENVFVDNGDRMKGFVLKQEQIVATTLFWNRGDAKSIHADVLCRVR